MHTSRKYIIRGTLSALGICFLFVHAVHAQKFGDNLGKHVASKDLKMQGNAVLNSRGLVIGSADFLDSANIALQIDAANKAILISRVADSTSIVSPKAGMIIYSTNDNKFYFRQRFKWVIFASANSNTGVTKLNGLVGAITMAGDGPTNPTITVTLENDFVATSKIKKRFLIPLYSIKLLYKKWAFPFACICLRYCISA